MGRKVVVVGAGIVGLTLAKELAIHGVDVQVYDAKREVSDGAAKASGIFSISGLGLIGIDPATALVNRLNGAVLHAGRERLRIKASETKAYVVDRAMLAKSCREAAARAGAHITLGKRFDREELRKIASDKENIIVGADGAVSTVASAFSFPKIKEYVLTYKAEYRNAAVDDPELAGLFFSNEIAYRFFGWSCPYSKDRVEIGIGISDRAKISSSAAFAKFAKSDAVSAIVKNAERVNGYASIIPLSSREITVKDNVVLVGDAAGQVKATTGGGVIFGCSCAKVLAQVIRANIEKGTSLRAYEKEWRKRYGVDLKMHDFLHNYYSNLRVSNMEVFLKVSKMLGAEKFFSEYGDMDRPSLMLKRFFLRGLAK
ncbi:MAG: NAD(P)/FAD-dependent oxidoreductase [Candidatus Micrarchaeaceae archaeon]|jgi:flavin-dependent dehydrogenase|nr:NAD(P)/FAD-dependent oxidoreductase [Candidatus Micrarchaeota archaeon]